MDSPSRVAASGLTSVEAQRLLARHGPNRLPEEEPHRRLRGLTSQFVHFFALLLWAAAGLAFIARLPQLGVAIIVVVVINGVFAYVQEARAERAARALQDLLPHRANVLRDGNECQINAADLVVGDVVVLREGDRVSADLVVDGANQLALDTSMLTGESVPNVLSHGEPVPAGTFVVSGEGWAVVRATGANTRLASLARLTRQTSRPRTPLARELDRVVRAVAAIAIGVGGLFFVLSLLIGASTTDGFVFAIGVTVALVPEGLLPTVTLALAIGAQRMARRHALVRRLESVETLGSTTFICSDKTGTLTRNELCAVTVWTPRGTATVDGVGYEPTGKVHASSAAVEAVHHTIRAALRCSQGSVRRGPDQRWEVRGDAVDAAVGVLALRAGIDRASDETASPTLVTYPFDPHRRRSSVLVSASALSRGSAQLLVKGAPEAVLERCIDPPDVEPTLNELTDRGQRVLAVAFRVVPQGSAEDQPDALERDLTLLGLIAFEDPPREGTASAIARCRAAGIRVAMLTGDHPRTAHAIAQRLGLTLDDAAIIDGRALPTDDAVLGAMVDRDGVVISRVTPEDKLRIAHALQSRGHVVAMTGDGVNDGPALQAADIGIAMGRNGTDVAREAADLVLLNDEFGTIVDAVEQGRATYANVRRFLTYHLTDNVAELTPFVLWALSGGRFPLALGVLQVLCLDIGTDLLPALALGAEPSHHARMPAPLVGQHLFDRSVLRRALRVLGPVEATVEILAFVASLVASGWRPGEDFPTGNALLAASGAAFMAVVFGQLANAYACRSSTQAAWRLPVRTNPLLLGAVIIELGLLAMFLLVPQVAEVLEHRPPSLTGFAVALLAAPAVLVADAIDKRHQRNHAARHAKLDA